METNLSIPAYLSDPQIQYLSQLLEEIARGHLLLPRFQRPFVWKENQRVELLRSILSGTPIGSILVWRTSQHPLACQPRLGPHRLPDPTQSQLTTHNYLLDGLQRLSTLFGALYPQLPNTHNLMDDDEDRINWNIYYDLEEEDFEVQGKRKSRDKNVRIPLHVVLRSVDFIHFQRQLADRPNADKLIQRADQLSAAILRYKIPVIPIVTEDLAAATLTFQRINSQGTPMSQVHMVQALTWSSNFDLTERLSELKEQHLADIGWQNADDRTILNICKTALDLDITESNVDEISKSLKHRPQIVEDAVLRLRRAAEFLRDRCEVRSPHLLPYNSQVVFLADALASLQAPSEEEAGRLRLWFWYTTYTSYFQVVSYTRLRQSFDDVRSLVKGKWAPQPLHKLDPLPSRFDFRTARIKAIAIRLSELQRHYPFDRSENTPDILSAFGSDALPQLLLRNKYEGSRTHEFTGPANRFLTRPEDGPELRRRLLETEDRNLQEAHAIPEDAIDALRASNLKLFFSLRLRALEQLDEQFARRVGILAPLRAK